MVWLTSLPVSVLVIISLAITMSVAFGSRLAVRRWVPGEEVDHVGQIAAPLMPALGAAFGLLMALTLAGEASHLRDAQDIVADEAAAASRLAWAATSPGVASEPLHAALGDYLTATRAEEWRDDGAAHGRAATAAALGNLEVVTRTQAALPELGTPASTELYTSLDALSSARRQRIAAASYQLPALYVVTLLISGLALIVNAGALGVRSSLRTSLLVSGLALVVGMSMSLLFALSAPWRGALLVSGEPIDAVIRDLRSGFFG